MKKIFIGLIMACALFFSQDAFADTTKKTVDGDNTYITVYDDNGNLIVFIHFADGKVVYAWERVNDAQPIDNPNPTKPKP